MDDDYEIVPVQAYLVRCNGEWIIDPDACPWVFYDRAVAERLIAARQGGEYFWAETNPPQHVPVDIGDA